VIRGGDVYQELQHWITGDGVDSSSLLPPGLFGIFVSAQVSDDQSSLVASVCWSLSHACMHEDIEGPDYLAIYKEEEETCTPAIHLVHSPVL